MQSGLNNIETRLNQLQPASTSAESSDAVVQSINQLSVYPNPVKSNLSVIFNAKAQSSATIMVTDIHGNNLIQKTITAVAGANNININISQLAQGAYILQLQLLNSSSIKKFIKE